MSTGTRGLLCEGVMIILFNAFVTRTVQLSAVTYMTRMP